MLCGSSAAMWYKIKRDLSILSLFIKIPVQQDNSSVLINQLSSQKIKTCIVQHWGEMPGPHSSFFMAYINLTQDHWVDSTLALPWERRSALEHLFYGVQPLCLTIITPTTHNLYLVRIGQSLVPLHFSVWWPWLFKVSCLETRFCHYRAWYFVLRDTTKPTYHSKNPRQQVVLSWPKASLSLKAWC